MRKWESPKLFNLGLEFTHENTIIYYSNGQNSDGTSLTTLFEYGFRCRCCGYETGYIFETQEEQKAAAGDHKRTCSSCKTS